MPKSLKNFRDKEKAKKYRNKCRIINYKNGDFKDVSKKTWTHLEENLILKSALTDRELAKELKRSVKGIQQKRLKLKKRYCA